MIGVKCILSLSLLAYSHHSITALATAPSSASGSSASFISPASFRRPTTIHTRLHARDDSDADECAPSVETDRRNALRKFSHAFLSAATVASVLPRSANAESELFKKNPLTNSVLEQVRIWNQDEVDNIKYGGELESGSAKPAALEQYATLLQPILAVERDLAAVDGLLKQNEGKSSRSKEEYVALFEKAADVLARPLFDRVNFKKAFNAFADNIYYSDPDRANLYLGGGAVPKNEQSIAYLVRNDVLTNVEDMRAETAYLLRELSKRADGEMVSAGGEGGLDLDEIVGLSRTANGGMVKYLGLVPPKELEVARQKFAAN